MTAIIISRDVTLPIEVAQYVRNGKPPTADLQNQLATAAGYAAYVTSKPIFHSAGQLVGTAGASLIPSSLATRYRWRFAFHTGPYAWYLMARFEIAPQDNGTATDPYCKLEIYNTSNTLVGTCNVHGGSSGGTYADVPINMTGGVALVLNPSDLTAIADLDPDTEYTGVFADVGYARLQSASVWEVSLNPDTDNGYAPNNLGAGGPIYSSHRNDVAAMARLLHKRSGTPVFHWCSNVDSAAPVQASGASTGSAAIELDALTISATGTVGGTGVMEATLDPITVSSTGTTASFAAVVSLSGASLPGGFKVDITAAGVAQTNAEVYIEVEVPSTSNEVATTLGLDGWTEDGWEALPDFGGSPPHDYFGPVWWRNRLTRASVSIGTTTPTFNLSASAHSGFIVTLRTYRSSGSIVLPNTDQVDEGTANSLSTALT